VSDTAAMQHLVSQTPERTLGRTGITTRALGVGGICPQHVVEKALEYGLTFYDIYPYTAGYPETNEVRFGRALKAMKKRANDLVTTSRLSAALSSKEVLEHIDRALANIGADYIDIHGLYCATKTADQLDTAFASGGAMDGLKKARDKGKIRHIAISGHQQEGLIQAIDSGEFDVVMVAVNIFDQDMINGVLPPAKRHQVGTIAMKPFAYGLFVEAPEAALRYVLAQDVSVAIPGMKTVEELEQNIRAAAGFHGLSTEDRQGLKKEADEITKSLGKNICRQCGYCLPACRQQIDIKQIFHFDKQARRFWNEDWAKAQYAGLEVKADSCVGCGNCEEKCPYSLPIREMLKETHELLTG
jgi:uncharacterized protein